MQQTFAVAGAVDQSVLIRAFTAADGLPKTDIVFNTATLTINYKRGATGAVTSVTPITQTSTGAHADGGFVHLNAGVYRVDLPDAAVATGAPNVAVMLAGVAGAVFTVATIEITGSDARAARITEAQINTAIELGAVGTGVAALPSAAAVNTAVVAGAVGTNAAAIKAKTDSLTFTSAGLVDANTERINNTDVLGVGTALNKWRG